MLRSNAFLTASRALGKLSTRLFEKGEKTGPAFEVRLVASPTRGFFGQVALFAASMAALGYTRRDAVIKVFLGAKREEEIDPLWRRPLDLTELVWSDREDVVQKGIYAQCDDAFANDRFDAPVVVFCDTDTVWIKRIDALIERFARGRESIAGVMAHFPPPGAAFQETPQQAWDALGQAAIGQPLSLGHFYSIQKQTLAPFYLNFGFVVAHSRIFSANGKDFLDLTKRISEISDNEYFKYQLAIPYFCSKYAIDTILISESFNYVNDTEYERIHQYPVDEIYNIHYLRKTNFDGYRIFAEPDSYRDFLSKDLRGVEEILQRHVRKLWGEMPPHLQAGEARQR